MATRNFAKYLLAALLAAACTAQDPTEDTQAPSKSEPVASSYNIVPGQATIQFTEDMAAFIEAGLNADADAPLTKSAEINAVLSDLGAVSLKRVFPDAGRYEKRSRQAGLHLFYEVVFSDQAPMTKAVVSLSEMPGVVSVTPHHRIEKRAVFNDPYLSRQWEFVSGTKADIHVREVWQNYTTGSSKVIVDVVDEPIDPTHEDLKDNLWKDSAGHTGYNFARESWDLTIRPEGGYVGWNWVDGDIGHGTHVAGTISAVNNNGKGLCGVAGGNAAQSAAGTRLMSSAIFSGFDAVADDPATARAIKYGADNGALISQNSWGLSYDEETPMSEWMSYNIENTCPVIKAAVDYFIRYAGCDENGNQLPSSPMKGGLVIFAAGNDNVKWDVISSYDPIISVGAYGLSGGKASYSNYGDWVDVAAPGGDGTTAANSIWSTLPKVVEDGTGYGGTAWVGTSMACPHVSGVAALIISYFGGEGFTAEDARKILFGGLGETVGGIRPIGRRLDAAASFSWALANGYTGQGGGTVVQNPPVITLEKTSVTVKAHEMVRVAIEAYDPDGDNVTLSCKTGSDALTLDKNGNQLLISGWKARPGTYTAVVTVSDGVRTADAELSYTILPNHAPTVKGKVNDVLMSGLQKVTSISMDGIFADEDGETLSIYADRGDALCVRATVVGDGVIKLAPITPGLATITVTATDFMGESAVTTFRVAVTDPKQPVRVYPEVASTEATISIETESLVQVKLSLYASTGGLVYKTETEASAFDPIKVDVSALAPGRYTAVLEYGGETRQVRVIKY